MTTTWRFEIRDQRLRVHLHEPSNVTLYGEAEGTLEEIMQQAAELRQAVQAHIHDVAHYDITSIRAKARLLFGLLCPENLRSALESMVGSVLQIQVDAELEIVPWEFLHDKEDFLFGRYHLVRGIALPQPLGSLDTPTEGSMMVVADPSDELSVAADEGDRILQMLEAEYPEMKSRVGSAIYGISRSKLRDIIWDYEILHFAGHLIDHDEAGGSLKLHAGETLTLKELGTFAFGRALPALVFLNGCGPDAWADETSSEGRKDQYVAERAKALRAMATQAMELGSKAVVCVSVGLPERPLTAAMAESFYRQLMQGQSVSAALAEARAELRDSYPEQLLPGVYALYGDPGWKMGQKRQLMGESDAAAAEGEREYETGSKKVRDTTAFSFSECRGDRCSCALPPERRDDPFNAYCDHPEHRPSIAEKRQEALRYKSAGILSEFHRREDVQERVNLYMNRLIRRISEIKTRQEQWIELGQSHPHYFFRVCGSFDWTPLVHGASREKRLQLLGDKRVIECFPFEGFGLLRIEIEHKPPRSIRAEKRICGCLAIMYPDMEALLRDDFLWRPIAKRHMALARNLVSNQPQLRTMLANVDKEQFPTPTTWAWLTPLGTQSGDAACRVSLMDPDYLDEFAPPLKTLSSRPSLPMPKNHLQVSFMSDLRAVEQETEADAYLTSSFARDAWERAAHEAFAGLLDPMTQVQLQQNILSQVRLEKHVEMHMLARRVGCPEWLLGLAAETLAGERLVRVERLDAGTMFVQTVQES